MDYSVHVPIYHLEPPRMVAGEWYLKGFADAYHAHQVVAPLGPAGEAYQRGYGAGLEAVQRDFFAAVWTGFRRSTSLVDARGARWPLSVVGAPMTA